MPRPQSGEFYRHYKHDPNGPEANFTYLVLGTGLHTEDRTEVVIYIPLHKEVSFLGECNFCVRPYDMFVESIDLNGIRTQRFTKITDESECEKLQNIYLNLSRAAHDIFRGE